MARVLAYTSPARGHLYPLVPILDELDDPALEGVGGRKVNFAGGADQHSDRDPA